MTNKIEISWFRNVSPSKESMGEKWPLFERPAQLWTLYYITAVTYTIFADPGPPSLINLIFSDPLPTCNIFIDPPPFRHSITYLDPPIVTSLSGNKWKVPYFDIKQIWIKAMILTQRLTMSISPDYPLKFDCFHDRTLSVLVLMRARVKVQVHYWTKQFLARLRQSYTLGKLLRSYITWHSGIAGLRIWTLDAEVRKEREKITR